MVWTPIGPCTSLSMVKPGVTDCSERPKQLFLPTIFHALCFVAELGAQKGPKMGSWQLHRRRPIKAARPPIEHDERSFSMWRSTNPSKGAKASITRSMVPPSVSRAVQCSRSDHTAKNVEIAIMGWRRRIRPMVAAGASTKALQEPIFGPFWAPNSATKRKA